MARISFETAQTMTPDNSGNNPNQVSFFNLKNDGDEAIVRIMHDSIDDFDIMTVHDVNIGGKFRKVACIRNPQDPTDNCPFCAANKPLKQRFFIHMVQYDNVNGQIVPKPVIWDRTANDYGNKIKNLLEMYGPLSDCIFKVKRNGKAGDMSTTYEIMYTNPQVFRADLYPKIPDAFNGYDVLGTVVLDKNFDELATFLATGSFPVVNNTNATASNVANVAPSMPQQTPTYQAPTAPAPNMPAANQPPFDVNTPQPAAWGAPAPNTGFTRPNRQY